MRCAAAARIQNIERYAIAAEAFEHRADLAVVACPIADEGRHPGALEFVADSVRRKRHALVHFAGDAPGGGKIHEDRLAGAQFLETRNSERFGTERRREIIGARQTRLGWRKKCRERERGNETG